MVFGLPEEENQDLCDQVAAVFQEIGEKPRIEATRLGKEKKDSGKARPVKVTLNSSTTVSQILVKAKQLKLSEKHGTVYISPDRSPVQRAQHRQLVMEMKAKSMEEPGRRHYIKGGTICSVDKAAK